jgi:hypothetical protein
MAEPVLNAPRVMSGISQGVPASMAKHMSVNREREASALADALDQTVDGIRRERAAAFGGEDEGGVRELPPQLAQCSHLVAAERMRRGLAVLGEAAEAN